MGTARPSGYPSRGTSGARRTVRAVRHERLLLSSGLSPSAPGSHGFGPREGASQAPRVRRTRATAGRGFHPALKVGGRAPPGLNPGWSGSVVWATRRRPRAGPRVPRASLAPSVAPPVRDRRPGGDGPPGHPGHPGHLPVGAVPTALGTLRAMLTFDQKLDHLATLALRVGVNLQPGQRLALGGPVESLDLLRRIATQAYELGAPHVHVEIIDERMGLIRALHAHDDTLDVADEERTAMVRAKLERGDAYLRVSGSDPDLMAPADPARVARMTKAASIANRPVGDLVQRSHMPWSIVAVRHPAVGAQGVPRPAARTEAVAKLWDAIFAATRADLDDPVAAWEAHLAQLQRRDDHLNARGYVALHLKAPGTDLRLGLADTHVWESGGSTALVNGVALRRQHAHRGGLHRAARPARRRHHRQQQAALVPGAADRPLPAHLPRRRGGGRDRGAGAGGAREAARDRRGRAPPGRDRAGAARRARSARAGCSSSTRSSTRTRPATWRSAAPTRRR